MQAFKAVWQLYEPSNEILSLLEEFRKMVNDCIRIGLAENVTSLFALTKKSYHQLARYDVPTKYRLTAVSKATGILKTYRNTLRKQPEAKKPYASKLMLTNCYRLQIADGKLRLPLGNKRYAFIPLTCRTQAVISGHTVKSVTLTACTLSIAFSKETAVMDVTGLIGIDRNLNNVTFADTEGKVERHDLTRATEVKEDCRQVKRGFTRNDYRIQKQLYSKYGRIQRNRVNWILHNTSANIIKQAKKKRYGIVMENLKGIRKLYRRGNGQGKDYRARLNSWSFYELQRQIEYKAKWEGIPVIYVHPSKTSSVCAVCGSKIVECTERQVFCPKCKRAMDRDENAALNIVRAGLRFSLKGMAGEAVKGNPEKAILRADTTQLAQHLTS